jgi:hypothetical protein
MTRESSSLRHASHPRRRWIQFEVHDRVFHGHNEEHPWQVETADDDPWHERPMRIQRRGQT